MIFLFELSAVEVKSVYVKNVPTTMAAYEIEEEFKKFGKLKPDAVAIRTRKVCSIIFLLSTPESRLGQYKAHLEFDVMQDIDVCYAFVEFEDVTGVQNAIEV